MNVAELRRSGYKVRVSHYRRVAKLDRFKVHWYYAHQKFAITDLWEWCSQKGGLTIVDLTFNNKTFSGESICSKNDNFCKKTGVKLALERALKKLPNE
jgi:hypothetical protein